MTDEPCHADQGQDTLQGIADYLRQENPNLNTFQAWNEALSIYRVQFSWEVLPPEGDVQGRGALR